MIVEKVNTQIQLVTEYINIFGIIIKLNNNNQFFIISVLYQQSGGQLQMQRRRKTKIINATK
jgi:hypothetical protein